jgi:SAM-dependent methyltransferase
MNPDRDNYDLFARFYDLFYGQREDDLAMYRDFALAADGAILELGCGTGRLLIPLARDGHRITGLDASPAMLEIAQTRVKAANLEGAVSLAQGDLRDFDLPDRFALAIIPINTFMHCYDTEQQLACLRCVRRHLVSGGRLVVDVYNPDLPTLLEADGRLVSDGVVMDPQTGHTIQRITLRRLDMANQTQHITFFLDEVAADGSVRRTTFPFRMRFVFRFEMELLLRMAGYSLEALYGSYDLAPFENGSEKMIFVARVDRP